MRSSSIITTSNSPVPASAMLMAAGLGTRLRPFTEKIPKALVPVLGVPVAQFALDRLFNAGVGTVIANVHHLARQAREGLHRLGRVVISDESNLLLGSGGGIVQALPHLGERFFILNADVLCDADLQALAVRHLGARIQGARLTLTIFPQGPAGETYREIHVDPRTQWVTALGEKRAGGAFFTGVSLAERSLFAHLQPGQPWDFVQDILLPALERREVAAYLAQGTWYDVGSPLLWWRTHLDLLDRLETGRIPQEWRRRIEVESRRIAPGVWCSRRTPAWVAPNEICGPAYFDAPLRSTLRELGPAAVYYSGQGLPKEPTLQGGIGFGPDWVGCQEPR